MIGYTTSDGEVIDLTPYALLGDISSWEWTAGDSYSFTYPANDKRTIRLRFADMETCDSTIAKMDNDTRANEKGKLTVNEWSLECNLLSGSFVSRNNVVVYDAVFIAYGNRWVRSATIEFYASTAPSSTGFDYPHDYPLDFSSSPVGESLIQVDSIGSCDFRMAIFGPVNNPSITIGGNNYSVNVSVPSGSILFIDSPEKRTPGAEIFMRSSVGEITNQFHVRQKGQPGSGTYIFEPIKPGQQSVTWSGRFGFTIELLESRTKAPDDRY